MSLWKLSLGLLASLALLELLLHLVVDRVREDFQWLITRRRDFLPQIDPKGLKKFLADGFDPELGWVRRPDTSHAETGRFGQTMWHTNSFGARVNPGFEEFPARIGCFGDSFTFCRQTNDDETWEHYLSQLTQTNVLNWGVGNHGIDQSLLRLKREYPKHPCETVIVGVVPDTISRILSTWKHFYEYGNTFGFKPRFKHDGDGNLLLVPNRITGEAEYGRLGEHLDALRADDFFYERKFLKEMISFPYLWSILRNPGRNLPLIWWNLKGRVTGDPACRAQGMQKIMDINMQWRLRLYRDPEAVRLLVDISAELKKYCDGQGCRLLLALLPQKDDILYIKENGHFYRHLLEELSGRGVEVIDLAPEFLKFEHPDEYYSDDSIYGGHFSKFGNRLVAAKLHEILECDQQLDAARRPQWETASSMELKR